MKKSELYERIVTVIRSDVRNVSVYEDLCEMLFAWGKTDKEAYKMCDNTLYILNYGMNLAVKERDYNRAEALRGLIFRVLVFSAPESFDHYLQALEYDRNPSERFYLPRREVLLGHVQALQRLYNGEIQELFLSQPPRTGKALADDTPILTKEGWKMHGDLEVGDEVIGLDGKFKKVLAVHPKCEVDRAVEFSNGERIVCHEKHEWYVCDRGFPLKKEPSVYETGYIENRVMEQGVPNHRGHRYIFQLPKTDYVQGEERSLPLDPYTFGVWLGDGVNKNPTICGAKSDSAIIEKIVRNGCDIKWQTVHKNTGVMYYGFGFRPNLQSMGMCYSRRTTPKRIPDVYLTASVPQRLELLAGLLDTDGTYRRQEHRYVFTTAEEELRDSFISLIATFGWRTCVVVYEPSESSSGIAGKRKTYCVGFNPDCEIPCALERKQNHEFSKRRAVAMQRISKTEPCQGNCITVEGGVYLAGRTLVPTHNSTLITMFYTWVFGKDSEHSNLYCSVTDDLTKAFYKGVLEVITDPDTYHWNTVFPNARLVSKDGDKETINIDREKKYPTLTARSLYGSLNGSCDCYQILTADDLLSGIEEARNPARLETAWTTTDNNLLSRAKESARILWIGTRWSLRDPIARRKAILASDERFKNRKWEDITIPALNDKDESNFDYKYGVGFSTEYYHQRRASFEGNNDLASWEAQYQNQPIEREATVFTPDTMRYYNGVLPEEEPLRIWAVCDPAFGGGDFVSVPIIATYNKLDHYVVDVLFNNKDKSITQPLLAKKLQKYNVSTLDVEVSKTTRSYIEGLQKELDSIGYHCTITTHTAPQNMAKALRIFDKAPDIRQYFIFRDTGHRTKEYNQFMSNVFSFTVEGKNKNDDAPDSLSMAVTNLFRTKSATVEVISRPF